MPDAVGSQGHRYKKIVLWILAASFASKRMLPATIRQPRLSPHGIICSFPGDQHGQCFSYDCRNTFGTMGTAALFFGLGSYLRHRYPDKRPALGKQVRDHAACGRLYELDLENVFWRSKRIRVEKVAVAIGRRKSRGRTGGCQDLPAWYGLPSQITTR